MKSLVLKDLYNIGHNARQMFILLLFLAVFLIPAAGGEGFIITSTILCSMMTVTTFIFDEHCKWEKYALIMPVSRKDYVTGKYAVNLIFMISGILFGIIAALVSGLMKGSLNPLAVMGCAIAGFFLSLLYGSIIIPLIIKFGTESARIIMMGTILVPSAVIFGLYKLAKVLNINISDTVLAIILGVAGILILILTAVSYRISIGLFEKKEL